jgi:hypothetical protein
VLAVAATRLIALALERRGIAPLRWLLGLQALLLGLFCGVDLALPIAVLAGLIPLADPER